MTRLVFGLETGLESYNNKIHVRGRIRVRDDKTIAAISKFSFSV